MSPAKTTKKRPSTSRARRATSAGTTDSRHQETVDVVGQLAKLAEKHSLSEVSIETDGLALTLRRGAEIPVAAHVSAAPLQVAVPAAAAPAAAAEVAAPGTDNASGHLVTSPFVGTFYRSPSPEADPYVDVGDRVEKGQVLCIVEAMKLMNEIEADTAGTIAGVLVQNAEAVEYGQALFRIEPA